MTAARPSSRPAGRFRPASAGASTSWRPRHGRAHRRRRPRRSGGHASRSRPRRRRAHAGLAARGARLAAVEIDPLRAEELAAGIRGADRGSRGLPGRRSRAALRRAGSTAAGWPGAAVLLVANLPYNAATPILFAAHRGPGVDLGARRDGPARGRAAFRRRGPAAKTMATSPSARAALSEGADPLRSASRRLPSAAEGRSRASSSCRRGRARSTPPSASARCAWRRWASTHAARRSPTRSPPRRPAPRGSRRWRRSGKAPRARAEELSLEDFLELARRVPEEAP